ncbi:MAG: hypothetical protein GX234_03495 [Clostridiales bacterium]|nr:hypothetical protein [Clostridiales bacterium]
MEAIFYLYKTEWKNWIKKAAARPSTYVWLIFIALYVLGVGGSFLSLFKAYDLANARGMMAVFTLTVFFFVPGNLMAYAKRKGLVFRQADCNVLFQSGISPKKLLLYAHMKNVALSSLVSVVIAVLGICFFHIAVWQAVLLLLVSLAAENVMEASLMVLLYGNERLGSLGRNLIRAAMFACMSLFVVIGVWIYFRSGRQIMSLAGYLEHPLLQTVPFAGWYIGILDLILMGPNPLNVAVSVCYMGTVVLCAILAVRMKCTGVYYEEALEFAKEYAEKRKRSRKGELVVGNKQKHYKSAVVNYRGNRARAILYRQILEYKKNRFFVFGMDTVLSIVLCVIFSGLAKGDSFGVFKIFVIPGVMAYLCFVFASVPGKWAKELEKPYTYLIPDRAIRKLWYMTVMEHVKSGIDGALMAVIPCILMKLPLPYILMTVLLYVCMQACKMYITVLCESIFGRALGAVGKQFMRLFLEGFAIGLGMLAAIIGAVAAPEIGFVLLFLVELLLAAVLFFTASSKLAFCPGV